MSEMPKDLVPLYHLEVVKDRDIPVRKLDPRNLTQSCADVLHELLDRSPVEQFVVLYVMSDLRISGAEKIAMGDLENVSVGMKNLFRGALIAGAPRIVLGHNHPQGEPTASVPDWLMTDTAIMCSELLQVQILDHIIVSPDGRHYSCWDHKDRLIQIMQQSALQAQLKDLMRKTIPTSKGPFGTDLDEYKKGLSDPISLLKESLMTITKKPF